ncbi:hypothetical protein ACFQDN_22730 [Pseudomonas asuensis]|uniref:Uncharacterized protein n=1 Tax=Pseudomonas asuensis TaxID=1825787 RepID=A0ABQ2H4U2_9PSED|nr:hypothetical protein [Pseudomonas asuensis]GGM32894.1 hypothetical protein GCM10009425_49200 [Pseudomonas asuensis]
MTYKRWKATDIRVKDMAWINALCMAALALVSSRNRLERAVSAISFSPLVTEMVERPVQVARQTLAQALRNGYTLGQAVCGENMWEKL